MSTAMTTPRNDDLTEIVTLGNVFKASGYFTDIRDQAQAVVKILYGRELGFSPVVSMLGVHIIEGKPSLSSNLMATLIKRSGRYSYKVQIWNATECVLRFKEKNGARWEDLGEASFSIEDAKTAKIAFMSRDGRPTSWTKYPKAMLFARALSQGLRAYCPDVSSAPLYVPEELGADVNEEGEVLTVPVGKQPVTQHLTTEPVTFKRKDLAALKPDAWTEDLGGPVPGTKSATNNSVQDATKRVNGEQASQAAETTGAENVPSSAPVEYISVPQQRNFHVQCRKANPDDNKIYQWLLDHGYKDKDGLPTAAMIPAAGWLQVRHNCVEWLKKQPRPLA